MRRLGGICASLWLLMPLAAPAATLLPLQTEEALTLPSAHVQFILSADYTRNQRFPYFTPKGAIDDQDLVHAPQIAVRAGLGEWAEVQASYELLYNDEHLDNGEHNQHFGSGDARLFTKLYLMRQREWLPALGLDFGAKLPDANFDDRLGTDETDFQILALASRDFGIVSAHTNLGIALLGNPGPAIQNDNSWEAGGQDDLFVWSLAAVSKPLALPTEGLTVRVLAELAGNAGSRFDNDRGVFRGGAQLGMGDWCLFAGMSAGFAGGSEDVGASAGVMYTADLSRFVGGD